MKFPAVLAFTILITACNAQDDYGLRDPALPLNSFTEQEKQNLQDLRDDWIEVSDKYLISVDYAPDASYNILLDSIASGPITTYDNAEDLVDVDYDWISEKPIDQLGVLGNNWRNRSLNPDIIYATKSSSQFFIYNREGEELFSYQSRDTLENGEVWFYNATFCFIHSPNSVGYFMLTRNQDGKPWTDFRIYSLSGEPLTSWKKREIGNVELAYYQDVDVYFGGLVQRNPDQNTVEITSFDGEQIFSMDNCVIKHQTTFPTYGLFKIFDAANRKAYLVNFLGEKVEVGFDRNYRIVKLR